MRARHGTTRGDPWHTFITSVAIIIFTNMSVPQGFPCRASCGYSGSALPFLLSLMANRVDFRLPGKNEMMLVQFFVHKSSSLVSRIKQKYNIDDVSSREL